MIEERDDTFLARWLSGELTPEELEAFERSEDFELFSHIKFDSDRFIKPAFDKEGFRERLHAKIDAPKAKVVRLRPLYYAVAAAASIILAVAFFFNTVTYRTSVGEQLAVNLPDGSEVLLNAKSELSHSRFFWKKNRSVTMDGEAFFKVSKGSTFSVATQSGTVSVLGTEFNIRSREENFKLNCYEGRVKFEAPGNTGSAILERGDMILFKNNEISRSQSGDLAPAWTKGQSIFRETPLSDVIEELELQYGIQFETGNTDTSRLYSGSFVYDNLEVALRAVLLPMGIEYTLSEDGRTVVFEAE